MVKKSFLARLFGRDDANGKTHEPTSRRSVTPRHEPREAVREATPPVVDAVDAVDDVAEVEEIGLESVPAAAPPAAQKPASGPNLVSVEMSPEEEVALRLQEGFQGINQVLSGIDRKIDQQQKSSDDLMLSVRRIPELMKDVPDASRAGLELLATISGVLEQQSRTSQELLDRLQDVPKMMDDVEKRLRSETKASVDAASAAQRAAETSAVRAEETLGDMRSKVDGLADDTARRQEQMLSELRRHQTESDRRLEAALKKSASTTKVMIFLVVLAIAAFLLVVNALASR